MAVKKKATAGAAVTAPAQAVAVKKYPVAKLRANCRQLFGVSASTYDGATYGMTGEYSVEEMRSHIKAWSGKKLDNTKGVE